LPPLDECIGELEAVVGPSYECDGPWLQRVRSAAEAALHYFDRNRPIAALLLVEAPKAGAAVQERRAQVLRTVRSVLGSGRRSGGLASAPEPELANEVLVEGLVAALATRLRTPERTDLSALLAPIMGVVSQCYLGVDPGAEEQPEAASNTARNVPRHRRTRSKVLSAVPMRMTYRTVRVLSAIAQRPGARNRDVGDAAGIPDPGQMSRLLAKLAGHGLIRNEGDGRPWAPNGWHLTARGEAIERAARYEGFPLPNRRVVAGHDAIEDGDELSSGNAAA
jgi:DNA-binding MarR family transcriptional regulator